jgi:endonuclease V-like protein UPF0215 family
LFGLVYRRAATMEASVNSFIKMDSLFVTDSYSKIINSHAMEWTNLKINVLMELAMKFQDREHQTFLYTMPVVGNLYVQQTSDPFVI